ncbi:MAG: hypothetical protein JSR60_07450 [Proteobacteria bacterium]|nr:hypothetical protein [Pseudomonadota bacterium]
MSLILGIVAGIIGWIVVVVGVSAAIRFLAPDLSAALLAHTTATAMAERLAISFAGSLFGGWLAATAGRSRRAALITGIVMLAIFVPYHLFGHDAMGPIWTSFPMWYHVTFFVSLPLLAILGGRIARR